MGGLLRECAGEFEGLLPLSCGGSGEGEPAVLDSSMVAQLSSRAEGCVAGGMCELLLLWGPS